MKHRIELRFLASFGFLVASLTFIFVTLLSQKPSGSFRDPIETVEKKPERKKEVPSIKEAAPLKEEPANIELADTFSIGQKQAEQNRTYASNSASARPQDQPTLSFSDAEEMLNQATELINKGSPLEAKRLLEQIVKDHPDHDAAITELALIHLLDLKDPATAQGLLEKAAGINPDNRIALGELVEIYSEVDQGKGFTFLRNLQEQNPYNPNVAQALGQLFLEDQPAAAAPYLESAVRNGNTSALPELAEAYTAAGNYPKAIEVRQREEDLAREKFEAGGNEFDKEHRITSAMNVISLHLEMGNKKQAEEKLAELKAIVANDREYLSILDHFNMSQRSNERPVDERF
ncbi:MAG: tetratricopeptide repeat protein [Deltaproteobacteria bacterium]|nr:tetratricopeptide repeat protein [Deltaproteobacteria bacterium]